MAKNVEPRDLTISGLKFKLTCPEHPEQYDVFSEDGKQVGYVRLRFGYLHASYPDCNGVVVYNTDDFDGDGYFEKDRERVFHLSAIADAILEYITTKKTDIDSSENLAKLKERHKKAKWLLDEERKQRRLLEEEVKKLKKQLRNEKERIETITTELESLRQEFVNESQFLSARIIDEALEVVHNSEKTVKEGVSHGNQANLR